METVSDSMMTTNAFSNNMVNKRDSGEKVVTSVTLPTTTSPVSGVYLKIYQEGEHGRASVAWHDVYGVTFHSIYFFDVLF